MGLNPKLYVTTVVYQSFLKVFPEAKKWLNFECVVLVIITFNVILLILLLSSLLCRTPAQCLIFIS